MNKKTKVILLISCIVVLLTIVGIILFTILNTHEEPDKVVDNPIKQPEKLEYEFSVIAVGDALLHNGVYLDATTGTTASDGYQVYDFNKMFTYIKDMIEPYDLRFYNQETVIGGKNLGLSNYPWFNSPDEIGLNLTRDVGFNLVNVATNHTMDKGVVGATYSANFWANQEDIYVVGNYTSQEARDEVVYQEKNGITYALLGYTYGTNGITVPSSSKYVVNVYSDELVKQDIEAVRGIVDVVIVSMHWGTEYTHTPTVEQQRQAEYLASLGVDVIIGHHPHVIQPITYIGDTLVIYSLGNFISAQEGTNKRVGMVSAFDVKKTVEDNSTTIEIVNPRADLIWTYHENYKNFKVIPFNQLNDALLPGYTDIYEQYKLIITQLNSNIQIGV